MLISRRDVGSSNLTGQWSGSDVCSSILGSDLRGFSHVSASPLFTPHQPVHQDIHSITSSGGDIVSRPIVTNPEATMAWQHDI